MFIVREKLAKCVCVFSHAGGAAGRAQQVERLPHHQGDEKRFITLV